MVPFTIQQHEEVDFYYVTFNGDATAEALIDWMHDLMEDETYRRTQRIAIEAGPEISMQSPIFNLRRIEQWARSHEQLFTGSRWAVVTTSQLYFGITRMYLAWRHDATYELGVFREMSDAASWLTRP